MTMLRTLSQSVFEAPVTAGVSENAGAATWARETLHFTPSPKQAEVLDADAKYMVLCGNRQWGKSTTIAIKALHRALHQPGQSIIILSRTKAQAAIVIRYATRFLCHLNKPVRRVLGYPFSLQLPNGSEIIAVAHNGDTSVGHTATVLIVDEAALVKDEVYWSVSAAVSRAKGAIWLMSTPRRQAGFFFNIWHNGDQKWLRILSPVSDCPDIDPDYLEMQRKANPIRYRQDFLCEFIQPADRLFDIEMINRMVSKDIDQWHIAPIFGDHIPAPPPPEGLNKAR